MKYRSNILQYTEYPLARIQAQLNQHNTEGSNHNSPWFIINYTRKEEETILGLHAILNSGLVAVNLPTVLLMSKSRKFNQILTKLDTIKIKIFNFQFNLIVEDNEKSNFVIKT